MVAISQVPEAAFSFARQDPELALALVVRLIQRGVLTADSRGLHGPHVAALARAA